MSSTYLTKFLCLTCHKSLKRPVEGKGVRKCSSCGGQAVKVGHKFRPPKLSDEQGWKLVMFLIEHGFYFDSLWADTEPGVKTLVKYPTTMPAAKEFVKIHAKYAVPFDDIKKRDYKISR